ncbi:MAG TPA: hypothetical protein VMA77_30495 [Solirubrobacteraceae bacterium]|nr:hypothetical protein [Solirubrobacteraceae bacterium]
MSNGVATKDIRPSTAYTICDVCGRTLLRGERSEIYIDGGVRREVCELCKPRALHEGWLREGTVPTYDGSEAPSSRRGSFLTRLRRRRERERPPEAPEFEPLSEPEPPPVSQSPPPEPRTPPRRRARETARELRRRAQESTREPRHVRAVPMGAGQRIASAIEVFNDSEHRRTVAGVARSLGAPTVSIHPNEGHSSLVEIVASWELCWYRYEVDLSEEVPVMRVAAQGYELDELSPRERESNAGYDAHGVLSQL